MNELYSQLASALVGFGLNLLYTLIFVVVGFRLVKMLSKRLGKSRLAERLDPSIRSYVTNSTLLVLRFAVIVIAAMILGVPGSAFITVLGSAGVAVGLALQGSLSNLAGGLMLLFFRPFNVGDYIETADGAGTVTQISAFYTTIRTPDCKRIVLPNGNLTNNPVTNHSAEAVRMLNIAFNASYSSDPEQVRQILVREAQNNPLVLPDPAPVAYMTSCGENALAFSLRAWVARENYWTVNFQLQESVKKAFDSAGVEIPFPQMDIHMK